MILAKATLIMILAKATLIQDFLIVLTTEVTIINYDCKILIVQATDVKKNDLNQGAG
jgi:hypothetical protein